MKNKTQFEEQIKRIHEACGTSSLTELSVVLQAGMAELTDMRRRGKIPESWLLFLLRSKSLNPEWVLSGCGPRHIGPIPENEIKTYADGATTRERLEKLEALRGFSARELAEELLRRLAGSCKTP